jgi:hypothetical protein
MNLGGSLLTTLASFGTATSGIRLWRGYANATGIDEMQVFTREQTFTAKEVEAFIIAPETIAF